MPKYKSDFSAFVPIGNGCDNFCTYCVVPHARGREVYRDVQEIIAEVKNLVKRGYREINLIAQNVNSYKDEKGVTFPKLLKMVNEIEGGYWIRFSTSHPKDMSGELIDAISECDKVCHHVHLPVQSGDNEILERMNRKYTVEHYKGLIKKIRSRMPDVAISTDIIVGFPGETREQFENTVKLFKDVNFDLAYISQYSPRPGTAAFNMDDDVEKVEKKRRDEKLMGILRKTALKNNQKYKNKTVKVLIESKKSNDYFGTTSHNKTVRITGDNLCVGKFAKVKVLKVRDFGLDAIYEKK